MSIIEFEAKWVQQKYLVFRQNRRRGAAQDLRAVFHLGWNANAVFGYPFGGWTGVLLVIA